jgi:gluconolactonase
VLEDGRLGRGETFLDLTREPGEDAIDGVETDELGNVYVSGPGGLWIVAPDGTRLALVRTPRHVHNLAWGEDGTVLYLAARDHLYRMPLRVRGHAPHLAPAPRLEVVDAELGELLPEGGRPERLAQGFRWLEGPAWDVAERRLLFSDIPANRIYELTSDGRARIFLEPSGYSGDAPFAGREPGSNGLVEDAEGRLILCQHGDRRVVRRERDGSLTVLADRFDGRRLNSPNDAIATPSGEIWFTDPPFGLPGGFDDPGKELPFQGVYRVRRDGRVDLLTSEVRAPNGLALSPDGRTLYVSNAEPGVAAHYYAFEVHADGTLGPKRLFFDATAWSKAGRPGAPDGIEVDPSGRVWATGPGGVHVFTAAGRHLGTIAFDRPVANLEFGDDGDLYLAADTAIWRLRTRAFGDSTQGVSR